MPKRPPPLRTISIVADLTATGALAAADAALLERMQEFLALAIGAYAANTLRAWRADFRSFATWCADRGVPALPATASTVQRFIQFGPARLATTARRQVSSIGALHRGLRLPDPTDDPDVRLALKGLFVATSEAARQARPMSWPIRQLLVDGCGPEPAGRRDAALIACLYDGLFRRTELVGLQREDLHLSPAGATIRLRRSKTDRTGRGAEVYLAPDTAGLLEAWCRAAGIDSGPLFRPITTGNPGSRGSPRVPGDGTHPADCGTPGRGGYRVRYGRPAGAARRGGVR